MKNLVMTPRSSSPSPCAPSTLPMARRIGGMSAMKMTRTRGGRRPVNRPPTILKGPDDGSTDPMVCTHFWMAPTGMR